MTNAQTKVFGRKKGAWVWCLHCERCYQVGEFKFGERNIECCPYPDCDGDTLLDSIPWTEFHKEHSEYPEIPEREKTYPMYT